jgi:hypothetical protein
LYLSEEEWLSTLNTQSTNGSSRGQLGADEALRSATAAAASSCGGATVLNPLAAAAPALMATALSPEARQVLFPGGRYTLEEVEELRLLLGVGGVLGEVEQAVASMAHGGRVRMR